MKILFATHFFPPGHAGGTESYTLGLAKALRQMGHIPSVICAEDWGTGATAEPRHRETTYDDIPVRRLAWNWELTPNPFVYLYDNPLVERHVAQYLRELAPDVMHITSCYSLSSSIIRAAHEAGVPTVLTLTDFWFLSPRQTLTRGDGSLCDGPRSAIECARCLAANSTAYRVLTRALPSDVVARGLTEISRWPVLAGRRGLRGYVGDVASRGAVLRRAFDLVDVAIAPSRALKDVFVRNDYPAERLRVSPYGLDADWTSRLRPRAPAAPLCFGYIGQIEPIKGVDLLVQAFGMSDRSDWQLKIFGGLDKNPAFTQRLVQLSAADQRIQFMGQFERAQIADALSQLDVVVVPSVWFENAPVVISEAFAAGKAVIATDLPGMSELVEHDVNGLVFPRGDVVALAATLARFADGPALRARLVSGIKPVRTIEEEAAALADLYARLAHPVGMVA